MVARLLVLLATLGCAAADDLDPELERLSVVSVRSPYGHIPASGSYGWLSGSGVLGDGEGRMNAPVVERMLRDTIGASLARRGFKAVGGSGADLRVGFVAGLDQELDDAAVSGQFGMDPGLGGAAAQRYDTGTLIIEVVDGGSGRPLWRGAVQMFADLDLDDEVRRRRIEGAVELLLARLPTGS